MKAIKVGSFVILITMFAVGYVLATGNTVKQIEQATCPVMGGTINQSLYTDYEGKRVYFCCEGCVPEFQKDPAPVIELLEKLKEDPNLMVRRSVANNLNDISKDNPDAVIEVLQRWQAIDTDEMRRLISHAHQVGQLVA